MRHRKTAVALIATLASLAGASTATANGGQWNDGPQCQNGRFCYWMEHNYGGYFKWTYDDTMPIGTWIAGDAPIKSAKNQFGNRRVQFQSVVGGPIRCLNPNENDPVMGGWMSWRIGAAGSRC